MDLKITRSLWIHGEGNEGNSKLLRTGDGHMCCLGFYLKACGVEDEALIEMEQPDLLAHMFVDSGQNNLYPDHALWLLNEDASDNSGTCWDMMNINDDDKVSEEEREKLLAEKFAENDVNVTFED